MKKIFSVSLFFCLLFVGASISLDAKAAICSNKRFYTDFMQNVPSYPTIQIWATANCLNVTDLKITVKDTNNVSHVLTPTYIPQDLSSSTLPKYFYFEQKFPGFTVKKNAGIKAEWLASSTLIFTQNIPCVKVNSAGGVRCTQSIKAP